MDSIDQLTPPPVPRSLGEEGKVHTWMLILLVWIAVFSLISVGLLLTKSSSSSSLSNSDITSACQDGTINAITTNLTRIADACEAGKGEKKDTTIATPVTTNIGFIYDASDAGGYLPKVSLPSGWSSKVFWNVGGDDKDQPVTNLSATKGTFYECSGCSSDRGVTLFSIVSSKLTGGTPMMDPEKIKADYAEKSKAEDTKYTNIVVTSSSVAGGTLISIDGEQEIQAAGNVNGPFHILRFANTTKVIGLEFNESNGATNADWLIIKDSLDWSTVK